MSEHTDPNLTATLVQVAELYYRQNLSQQQIADELGVSRSLIALYLKMARERRVVRFEILDPQDSYEDLAQSLQARTGAPHVAVVPSSHNSPTLTRRSIAGALARFLENSLEDGDCVGLGFGRTVGELADLLVPTRPRNVDVVPLMGESASGLIGTYSQVNLHVLKVARSFSGVPHFLLAPLMLQSASLRDQLMGDAVVHSVAGYWDRLSHVCVGVGTLPPAEGEVVYIGEENINEYLQAGAVGDVCVHFFDAKGVWVESSLSERIIGVRVEQMQRARNFIALASGAEKAHAIAGLLHGRLVTDLFVDEELARAVIGLPDA